MPRSKTRKPRQAARSATTDTVRRAAARKVIEDQRRSAPTPSRRQRFDLRPPRFPGKLGGR